MLKRTLQFGLIFVGAFIAMALFDAYHAAPQSPAPLLTTLGSRACTGVGTGSSYRPFLQTAMAQNPAPAKTELGPFGNLMPSAQAVAEADANPELVDDLGTLHFPVTTKSEQTQRYFDQGIRLAYAFNHAEAQRAFRKARTFDANCAMCYWGEALVLGPNINAPMDESVIPTALSSLKQARSLARGANDKERALIDALSKRYKKKGPANEAYAQAMKKVLQRFPNDDDIAVMYAESLLNLTPWDYWSADGATPKGSTKEIVDLLERVLARSPDHPGAIHFYIHITEASADVQRAVPFARRLGDLMPGAGHIVHMPFHTFFRVGMYKEAIESNRKAVIADEAFIARAAPTGMYPLGYYPHNVHSLMVSAQMAGDAASVIDSANKLEKIVSDDIVKQFGFMQPVKAAPYFAHAQFSDLQTVLALKKPDADLTYTIAMWHYARGAALARSGQAQAALEEANTIAHLERSENWSALTEQGVPVKGILHIAENVVRGRVALAGNDLPGAIGYFDAAVKEEDALPYSEPPYWYYPVRQSLGAALILAGQLDRAESVLGTSLLRAPNDGWALYALTKLYEQRGDDVSARTAREKFSKAWLGDVQTLNLARL